MTGQQRLRYCVVMCIFAVHYSVSMARAHDAGLQLTVSVYHCVINGQRVFSDQPCAKDAEQREIAESNRMNAQDTRIMDKHEPAPKRRNDSGDGLDKKKAACNKLREQQLEIRSHMRTGYTAKQGEQLRVRLDKLIAKYGIQKCERYR